MAKAAEAEKEVEEQEETPVLTEEEQKAIESEGPPEDYANVSPEAQKEEASPGEKEQAAIDAGKTDEEIAAARQEDEEIAATAKEAQEQDDADAKKAADELAARAKAAGLAEGATEEEVAAAEKQKEEDDEKSDPFMKIETELAKPEGQEDLTNFTKREKAYFFQMRRDRKSRQEAEKEKDAALFRESQLKKQLEGKGKEEKPAEEDPLAGKDDEDFMTVADVKKLLEKQKTATPAAEEAAADGVDPVVHKFLEMSDNAAREAHPEDYDEVMELTKEIINTNPEYVKQVGEALQKGENPAEVSYNLIKGDPEFAKLFPAAQIRWRAAQKAKKPEKDEKTPEQKAEEAQKAEDAKKAQAALEKNKTKTKTTASVNAGLTNHTGEELSAQQIADMSDIEFAKLPKPTRDRYLKLYG